MMKNIVFLIFSSLLITFLVDQIYCEKDQRVKLTDVSVITLLKDKLSNARRLPPIPQLKCINTYINNKCATYAPEAVQCYNRGSDGVDVNWECKADLDKAVRFGELRVSCEGYEYPDDPYILAGSCVLEYTLITNKSGKDYNDYYNRNLYETSKLSNFLTLIIMVFIVLAVYKSCNKHRENDLLRRELGSYAHIIEPTESNFNLEPNVYPPPPPPYGFANTSSASPIGRADTDNLSSNAQSNTNNPSSSNIPPQPGFKPEFIHSTSNSNQQTAPTSESNNWGSFLSGAAVGGMAGYFLNRRSTSPTRTNSFSNRTTRTSSPPPAYESRDLATGFATTSRR